MFDIAFMGWGLYDQVRTQRTQTARIGTPEGVEPLMLVNEQLSANKLLSANGLKSGQPNNATAKSAPPVAAFASPPPAKPTVAAPNKASSPTTCWNIGPFASVADRTVAYGKLSVLKVKLAAFEQTKHLGEKYLVYFPPAASQEDAERKLKELKARGVQNVQIIAQGELARAISLGEFATQRKASERIASIKGATAMGAKIKSLERERLEYWLKSYEASKTGVSKDVVAHLAPTIKGVERKPATCK